MFKWVLILLVGCTTTLNAQTKVLAFSGSTREDSSNGKLVREAVQIAEQMGAKATIINLKDYSGPFYDADLEITEGMPINSKKLRKLMIESDAIIIASPEYNASLPAVLKNAIDWATRDEQGQPSRDAFKGKRFAIMSTSSGAGGGSRGLVHLRQIIEGIGGEVVTKQVAVPSAHTNFDKQGKLTSAALKEELKQEVQELLKTPS